LGGIELCIVVRQLIGLGRRLIQGRRQRIVNAAPCVWRLILGRDETGYGQQTN